MVLCAAGQNLRLVLRAIEAFITRYLGRNLLMELTHRANGRFSLPPVMATMLRMDCIYASGIRNNSCLTA